jgi:arylsulfatase A-like enzyme
MATPTRSLGAIAGLLVAVLALGLLARALVDGDRDGAWEVFATRIDCDDTDPEVHPGALERPLNGRDEDCDGFDSIRGSNVVLLTIDTLRARNLGAYGYERDTSPGIDALARSGTLFLDAFAPSPWTLPSLGSLLTSTHARRHRAMIVRNAAGKRGVTAMRKDVTVLGDVLREDGYETAVFFESAYPLDEIGVTRGFQQVEQYPSRRMDQIGEWIAERRDRKFFLWLHFLRPHVPYRASPRFDRLFIPESWTSHEDLTPYWEPEECTARYTDPSLDVARLRLGFYDASIRDSDLRITETLTALADAGLTDRTLVVLTSDHGEEFFEHGGCDHGMTLYDEVLHVPLVFRHPLGVTAGMRVSGQARLIDVAPTILELLELEPPASFVGQSLVPQLRGERRDLPVFSGFLASGADDVSLRMDGFKYLHSPEQHRDALYDLREDPAEQENLVASSHHPRLREFRELTRAWLAEPGAAPDPVLPLDAETLERLEALGYRVDAPAP